MSSSKGRGRQRQLAKAKYERQLARRAKSARRRRQLQAAFGVLAVVAAGFLAAWFFGAFDSDEAKEPDPEPSSSDVPSDAPSESQPVEEEDPEGGGAEEGS
ncbi:MAG: hypothetical protein ACRDXX_06815 [Stackebrandtia sp.]